MSKRAILIVLDSVGIGALPDAAEFDDVGANTLGHIQERHPLHILNMRRLGIGHIEGSPLPKWEGPVEGAYGKCMEVTHAKDIVDKMNKRVVAIDHGQIVRDEEGSYGFVQQKEEEEDLYIPGFTTFLDPSELRAAQEQYNRRNESRSRTVVNHGPAAYDDSLVDTYLNGGEDVYE